ncbi:hypothetical protein B0T22DRAFT_440909 [Podospora appendiculata]|uniref:Uncharacterized protein n=1 Tax=Podospora appendiculata TaxID=314037 RepID=A0AAE0XB91_9PEZI|nr:hypothetical protein B0T22DRAFT_440909 [Podospora appendiculata]
MYIEDAVRVEVFDRLGMLHTCCKDVPDSFAEYNKIKRPCVRVPRESRDIEDAEDERQETKDEDTDLRRQLDMIMISFRNFARRHAGTGEELLSSWWSVLDEILPGIHVREWCHGPQPWEEYSQEWAAFRQERLADIQKNLEDEERELLSKKGYWDLPFLERRQRRKRDQPLCECWDYNGGLGSWNIKEYGTDPLEHEDGYWTD